MRKWDWDGSKWVEVEDDSETGGTWIALLGLPGLLLELPKLFRAMKRRREKRNRKDQPAGDDLPRDP